MISSAFRVSNRIWFQVSIACFALAASISARAQGANALYVTTFAGNPTGQPFNTAADGLGTAARFSLPYGVAVARDGNIYISDTYNLRICRITPRGEVTTVASLARGAPFNNPEGIAVDDATGELYIADAFNSTILRMTPAGVVTTVAGLAAAKGSNDGIGAAAQFNFPRGVALHGAYIYVTDGLNHTIRRIDKATGNVTTFAGLAGASGTTDGTGTAARFSQPWGIAIDPTGPGSIVVTDYGNQTIRRISLGGTVTTIAGRAGISNSTDGAAADARFFQPGGIAADTTGNLFVADTYNHTLRKITPSGLVSTIAGSPGQKASVDGAGSAARFSTPYGLALDASNNLYVADQGNATIRMVVTPTPPVITGALRDMTVDRAANVQIEGVPFTTSVFPTFQWLKDGQPVPGATNPNLRLDSAQAHDAGAYSVRLTNPFGTATSNSSAVTVRAPPLVASLPDAVTLMGTAMSTFAVTTIGSGPITYQWFRDGAALAGQTRSELSTLVPGAYTIQLTNAFGSTMSGIVQVRPAKRLVNLATLGAVNAGGETLVAGFSVKADEGRSKQFLIRAIGPALSGFGVQRPVMQPGLTLYRGTIPIGSNVGWSSGSDATQLVAAARSVGAFALAAGSADSAMLMTLAPGNYTVEVAGTNGTSGTALVEIYEITAELNRLVNLSTRGLVSETNTLTAGVVISGSASTTLLVRAVGPGLAAFGVPGTLAQTRLRVYSGSNLIATNVGWGTATNPGEIRDAAGASGAFPLVAGSTDSAVVLTVAPGNYTAEVTAIDGSGIALVEIYEVP